MRMTHTLTKHLFRFLLLMEEITSWYEKNIPIICKKLSKACWVFFFRISEPSTVLTTMEFPPPTSSVVLRLRVNPLWHTSLVLECLGIQRVVVVDEKCPKRITGKPRNCRMKADISVWLYTCMCLFSMLSIHFFHLKMELVEKTFWNFPVKWSHFFCWRIPLFNFKGVFFGGPENLYILQWWTLRSRIYTPVN